MNKVRRYGNMTVHALIAIAVIIFDLSLVLRDVDGAYSATSYAEGIFPVLFPTSFYFPMLGFIWNAPIGAVIIVHVVAVVTLWIIRKIAAAERRWSAVAAPLVYVAGSVLGWIALWTLIRYWPTASLI